MISRLAFAVFSGVIAFIVLSVVVLVLQMVGLGAFAAIVTPFVFWLAVLIGVLAFFGSTPGVWSNWKNWFN